MTIRKLVAVLFVLALSVGRGYAADSTVSALTAASALSGTELFYCVQSGADKKCTPAQLSTYVQGLVTGDCTISGNAITCTKTNTVAFGTFATANSATPPAIGGTTPAAGSFSSLKDTGITGSTQCIHADTSGAFTGTGSDCGGGGGGGQTIHPGYKAGNYYPPVPYTAATGTAVTANVIRCQSWNALTTSTVDTISVRTTTLATGGNAQIGIYAASATTKWPTGTPLGTTGQFSVDTPTGIKTGSFTAGTGNSGTNVSVTAGSQYYLCSNSDNATAVFIVSGNTNGYNAWLVGSTAVTDVASTIPSINFAYTSQTFGTWPDLTGITAPVTAGLGYAMTYVHITSVP